MDINRPTIERQLEVYKQFYEDEVRKREEAEKGIKDLQNICNDYREMLNRESSKHVEEVETIRRDAEEREREIKSESERSAVYSFIKFLLGNMAVALVIPILDKLHGCSWCDFARKLIFFPSCFASLIIIIEFIGMRFFKKHLLNEDS